MSNKDKITGWYEDAIVLPDLPVLEIADRLPPGKTLINRHSFTIEGAGVNEMDPSHMFPIYLDACILKHPSGRRDLRIEFDTISPASTGFSSRAIRSALNANPAIPPLIDDAFQPEALNLVQGQSPLIQHDVLVARLKNAPNFRVRLAIPNPPHIQAKDLSAVFNDDVEAALENKHVAESSQPNNRLILTDFDAVRQITNSPSPYDREPYNDWTLFTTTTSCVEPDKNGFPQTLTELLTGSDIRITPALNRSYPIIWNSMVQISQAYVEELAKQKDIEPKIIQDAWAYSQYR